MAVDRPPPCTHPLTIINTSQLLATDNEEAKAADLFGDDHPAGPPAAPEPLPPIECEPCLEEPAEYLNRRKPKHHPGNHTKEDLDKHNLTHASYHYRQTAEEMKKGLKCTSFDYKTMGEVQYHDDKIVTVVVRDRWIGGTFAHLVTGKGLACDWLVRQLTDDIDSPGYSDVWLKADTEHTITLVLERVKSIRDLRGQGETSIDPATPGQSQATGVPEKSLQDMTTQARQYKIALGTRLKQAIPATM